MLSATIHKTPALAGFSSHYQPGSRTHARVCLTVVVPITYANSGTFTLSATGGASAMPIIFASTTPSICSVTWSIATIQSTGACVLSADQAGFTVAALRDDSGCVPLLLLGQLLLLTLVLDFLARLILDHIPTGRLGGSGG